MGPYGRLDSQEPADAVKSVRITKEVTSIGASADNDIALEDPAVAQRHCRLQALDGLAHVVNLDAAGIVVAGAPLRGSAPQPLPDSAGQ